MAKFGLGRSLDDLEKEIGEVPNMSILTGAERVVVRKIPLSQIGANPNQPRKTFSDAELSDLAASIREKGVITPILLRSVTGQPYMYEIVAGERRFRASKLAGKTDIPAIIKTITNENAMEIALMAMQLLALWILWTTMENSARHSILWIRIENRVRACNWVCL